MSGMDLAEARTPEQLIGVGNSRKLLQAQCQPPEQFACETYCVARQFQSGVYTDNGGSTGCYCV